MEEFLRRYNDSPLNEYAQRHARACFAEGRENVSRFHPILSVDNDNEWRNETSALKAGRSKRQDIWKRDVMFKCCLVPRLHLRLRLLYSVTPLSPCGNSL